MNLNELNDSQRRAVECIDAPSLVIAGAGSGKTRVLTYKIAYLLEQGMKPWNILALTFTNKAAREMRERIGKLVGEENAAPLWMGTFHSIFCRILRREAHHIGFDSNFTIYDAADSKKLITDVIREMQLSDKQYKPAAVAARISRAKNALMLPSGYQSDVEVRKSDQMDGMPAIGKVYEQYFRRCRQSNAMDFDDLLLYTWMLFNEHPEVADAYQERFEFVLVDEYQDTNYAQHQIVWQLTQRRQMVSVVGDDAQSIYSFRGANIDNILRFQQRYPQSKLFKLEQNYRSTQTIVSAANSLISHNQKQIRKNVFSEQESGQPISLYVTQSDREEGIVVGREVQRLLHQEHLSANEIAILYRTNAQSRALEEDLRSRGIPYRIYGGLSFFQRKEIKDAVAYLRLAVNPKDEVALTRVINYPARGIGDTTLQRVEEASVMRHQTIWDTLQEIPSLDVNNGIQRKLQAFVDLIVPFQERATKDDAYTLAMDIIVMSGMKADVMKGRETEDIARQENLQELMDNLASFVDERRELGESFLLSDYLQEISLLTDQDEREDADTEKVTLMTVHASKGLEFDAVIVVGMEDNLFPSQMALDSPRQMEEERRLFYVAITRARKFLQLTCAKSRFRYGKMDFSAPSRFLGEIDPKYIQRKGAGAPRPVAAPRPSAYSSTLRTSTAPVTSVPSSRFVPVSSSPSSPAASVASSAPFRVGQRVQHGRFGAGVVKDISGTGLDVKAEVLFDNGETRKLLLRFANLTAL